MPLNVAANVNIDTLRNLDANKMYFLSSTTGQVKEASLWMRFKCAIGVQSARQKVANLVEAVRTTLLNAAEQTKDSALDTDIRTVDLKSMVKGSVIKDIASRFSAANEQKMVKAQAKGVLKDVAKLIANNVLKDYPGIAKSEDLVAIARHALKPALERQLPTCKNDNGDIALDENAFLSTLGQTTLDIQGKLSSVIDSDALNGAELDKHYAKHVIDTLYNPDGTASGKTVADLKTPMQVKVDVAFKVGQPLINTRPHIVHKHLQEAGIDPEKKLGEILGFCNGDKELEDYVLEIAPSLCLNSNNNLRSNESIQEKIAAIKDSLDEIKSLQKSYPGTAEQIKDSVSLLESSAFPKGTLTKIAEVIGTCSFTKISSLNSRSSASDIFKAMDELRVAIGTFQKEVDIDKIFADIGEEAGGPHGMAARNVAMTLILSKLGPGVTARLPHIVSSEQFDTMRAITTELKGQFHDHAPEVINGDDKAYKTASVIVNELDLAVDFFIENLNFGSERPVGSSGDVEFDINGEQAIDIRIYLGDVAEQSQV